MAKWNRNRSKTRRWQRGHLITKQSGKCALCDKPFEKMKDITFDHILAVSKGGDDTLENLQLAHFKCNQSKGAMSQKEWDTFQKGGELVE